MKPLPLSLCFLFACGPVISQQAIADHGVHSQCFCCAQKTCQLTVSTESEETECFEVECKDICIPPVTFPWECRPKKCGRVRTVNVLTTETRERQVCKYKWDVMVICPRCHDALQASGCDVAPGVQILSAPTPMADTPTSAPAASRVLRSATPLYYDEALVE